MNNIGVYGTPVFLFTSLTRPATANPINRKKTISAVVGIS